MHDTRLTAVDADRIAARLSGEVAPLEARQSLTEAACRLLQERTRHVPVLDGNDVIGVLTSDITAAALTTTAHPETRLAAEVADAAYVLVHADTSRDVVLDRMYTEGAHHAVVVNDTGEVLGVVPAGDLRGERAGISGKPPCARDDTEDTRVNPVHQAVSVAQPEIARVLFNATYDTIIITDPNLRIQHVNQAFTNVTGYRLDEVRGCNPRILQSGYHGPEFYRAMWEAIERDGVWSGIVRNRTKSGAIYVVRNTIRRITNDAGRVVAYVGTGENITQFEETSARAAYLETHDDLTGLPNRRMLLNRLKEEHERSLRSEQEFSVLMLDIDRFGRVNDLHGHQEGDRILRCVANTTWRNLRKTDFLARYGGEEFCGILPDTSLDKARAPAERIRASVEALEEPAPTVSIGLAEWRPWLDPEKLVSCADHALYAAKENGRNRVETYSSKRAPRKKPVAAG